MHPYRWSSTIAARLETLDAAAAAIRRPLPPAALASLRAWFRLHHVYHSNAIEGSRLTLPETRVVVEDGLTVAGKSFKEHAEAVDLAHAVDYLEELARATEALAERHVRELHAIVLRESMPEEAGRYRSIPVRITGTEFRPPEPILVPERMAELGAWLAAPDEEAAVVRSAIAHAWLATIHPFRDGNGRTARLLANLVLMRASLPLFVLRVERRAEYYAALDTSHTGDLTSLIHLTCDAVEEAVAEYRRAIEDVERMERG